MSLLFGGRSEDLGLRAKAAVTGDTHPGIKIQITAGVREYNRHQNRVRLVRCADTFTQSRSNFCVLRLSLDMHLESVN